MMKMKRWISLLLCVLLCVFLFPTVSFAAGETYSVTYNLTGMTKVQGPASIEKGHSLDVELELEKGYLNPQLTIKVGDRELVKGNDYTVIGYDNVFISIAGSSITDDVTITAVAEGQQLSDNATIKDLSYYDAVKMKSISLTPAEIEQAATPEGVALTLSHGNDGIIINFFTTLDDPKAQITRDPITYIKNGKGTQIIEVTAEDGVTTKTYTLHFTVDSQHVWGEPTWVWADDYSSATATFTCQTDSSHTAAPDVTLTRETVKATCTEDGKIVYTATVSLDGKAYTDERVETLLKTGHEAGTEWHSDAAGHWIECTACGKRLTQADHTFDWIMDKETGSKHEKCTVCGYVKAAEESPAAGTPAGGNQAGDAGAPETGDDSNIALWVAAMLAAGTTLTGTVLYRRKKKYSR